MPTPIEICTADILPTLQHNINYIFTFIQNIGFSLNQTTPANTALEKQKIKNQVQNKINLFVNQWNALIVELGITTQNRINADVTLLTQPEKEMAIKICYKSLLRFIKRQQNMLIHEMNNPVTSDAEKRVLNATLAVLGPVVVELFNNVKDQTFSDPYSKAAIIIYTSLNRIYLSIQKLEYGKLKNRAKNIYLGHTIKTLDHKPIAGTFPEFANALVCAGNYPAAEQALVIAALNDIYNNYTLQQYF